MPRPRNRKAAVAPTDAAPVTRRGRKAASPVADADRAPAPRQRRRTVAPAPIEIDTAQAARRGRKAAAEPEPRTTRTPASRRAGTARATAAGATAPVRKTAAPGGGARAYRRMPQDLSVVARRAGTAAAVADHYGVPRHTAQGWLRRLRDSAAKG